MTSLNVRSIGYNVILVDIVQQEGEAAVSTRVSRIPVVFVLKDVEGAHFTVDVVFNNHDMSVWLEDAIGFFEEKARIIGERQDVFELYEMERIRGEMCVAAVARLKIQHGMTDAQVSRFSDLTQIVIDTKDGNIWRNIVLEVKCRCPVAAPHIQYGRHLCARRRNIPIIHSPTKNGEREHPCV